jgi:hypothetical protein
LHQEIDDLVRDTDNFFTTQSHALVNSFPSEEYIFCRGRSGPSPF